MDVATPWLPGRDFLYKKIHGWKKTCKNEVEDYVRWLATKCLKQICSLTWGFVDPTWYSCWFWVVFLSHWFLVDRHRSLWFDWIESEATFRYRGGLRSFIANHSMRCDHFAVSNIRFSSDMSWHLPAQRWMQIRYFKGIVPPSYIEVWNKRFFSIPDPQQKTTQDSHGVSTYWVLNSFCAHLVAHDKTTSISNHFKVETSRIEVSVCVWSRFLLNSNMWWIYSKNCAGECMKKNHAHQRISRNMDPYDASKTKDYVQLQFDRIFWDLINLSVSSSLPSHIQKKDQQQWKPENPQAHFQQPHLSPTTRGNITAATSNQSSCQVCGCLGKSLATHP